MRRSMDIDSRIPPDFLQDLPPLDLSGVIAVYYMKYKPSVHKLQIAKPTW